mgnify:FL=1
MENIYLPICNVNDFACYSIYDKDTVRAYYTKPALDSSSNYVDFFINSHYLQKTGIQSWGQWNSSLPTCLSSDSITTDYYYRNDFPDILLIFIIFAIVGIYLPFKLISRIFRKGVL